MAPKRKSVKALLKLFTYSCGGYFFIFCLFQFFSFSFPMFLKTGFLQDFLSCNQIVHFKAEKLTRFLENQELAINFLSNVKRLTIDQTRAFQQSGLLHLLAISGGQVGPLATGIGFLLAYMILFLCRPFFFSIKLFRVIAIVREMCAFAVAFFCAFLFGFSGALVRVAMNTYFVRFPFFDRISLKYAEFFPRFSPFFWTRILILILIFVSFGNPFLNFSFLLSALGASCAEFSSRLIFYHRIQTSNSILQKLKNYALTTMMTSFLVGLLLSPLTTVSLINSSAANFLAQPIVGFLITPISLLLLFLPMGVIHALHLSQFFDWSLSLFYSIAKAFSYRSFDNPFANSATFFSLPSQIYIIFVLIIFWSLSDLLSARELVYFRLYFAEHARIRPSLDTVR